MNSNHSAISGHIWLSENLNEKYSDSQFVFLDILLIFVLSFFFSSRPNLIGFSINNIYKNEKIRILFTCFYFRQLTNLTMYNFFFHLKSCASLLSIIYLFN